MQRTTMAFTVGDFLTLDLLRQATVVGGLAGVEKRTVRWIAVQEWPVEDFVRPGEMILTSGVGCDERMLVDLVRTVIESGASGLCIGVAPGRYFDKAPPAAVALADDARFPLIELPWELRFADITQAVVDRVVADHYTGLNGLDETQRTFARLVMQGKGYAGIAEELERLIAAPVIVLSRNLDLLTVGPRAAGRLGPSGRARLAAAGDQLTPGEVHDVGRAVAAPTPRRIDAIPELGLPAGCALSIVSSRDVVGFLFAADDSDAVRLPSVEARAMEQAALAIALEWSRQRAAVEAEARARGHFLWSLAVNPSERLGDIAAKANLLGYDLRVPYHVLLVEVVKERARLERGALERVAETVRRLADAVGMQLLTAPGEGAVLVVTEAINTDEAPLRAIAEVLCDDLHRDGIELLCSIGGSPRPLAELSKSYADVQRTLDLRKAIGGSERVIAAADVRPFLLLASAARDEAAVDEALRVLDPLVRYDRETSRDFVETLLVYLEENGNQTATARRLFLNRHSLLYRLRRIEELTGCSLDSARDRFLLDLSLKLMRLRGREGLPAV